MITTDKTFTIYHLLQLDRPDGLLPIST